MQCGICINTSSATSRYVASGRCNSHASANVHHTARWYGAIRNHCRPPSGKPTLHFTQNAASNLHFKSLQTLQALAAPLWRKRLARTDQCKRTPGVSLPVAMICVEAYGRKLNPQSDAISLSWTKGTRPSGSLGILDVAWPRQNDLTVYRLRRECKLICLHWLPAWAQQTS